MNTIVLVEDDPQVRHLHATMLRSRGYTVFERASAERLPEVVRQTRPKAVLMDLSLPGVDGLCATALLRCDPELAKTRIVMVTAHDTFEAMRRATAAGVERYLVKPVRPDALVAAIEGQTPERKPPERKKRFGLF